MRFPNVKVWSAFSYSLIFSQEGTQKSKIFGRNISLSANEPIQKQTKHKTPEAGSPEGSVLLLFYAFAAQQNGFSPGYSIPLGWLKPISATPRNLNTSNSALPW